MKVIWLRSGYTRRKGRKTYEGYLDGLYGDVLKNHDEKSNVLEFDMKMFPK